MSRQNDHDVASSDRDDRLGEALETYLGQAEAGNAPDPEVFAEGYPDLREDLLSALQGLAMVQGLVGEPAGHGQVGRLETGRRIAGYRIVRELGRGGMGVVYEAVHVALDRPVALKILGSHATPDSTGRRRFLNEAKTAAGLHHTHIVPVFDVGQVGALCYYAMQRIEGSGLDRVIRFLRRDRPNAAGSSGGGVGGSGSATRFSIWGQLGAAATPFSRWTRGGAGASTLPPKPVGSESETGVWQASANSGLGGSGGIELLDPPALQRARRDDEPSPFEPPRGHSYYRWVAEVGREAAEALGHAHRRGIIHRDIKPSNLLVDGRGLVWVADFGLARRISDPGLSQADGLIGTPRYMSPEQAKGIPVDARSDLFSLGATLYELLTLRPPFVGKTTAELTDQVTHRDPAALRTVDPKIPRDLETIVLKLLAKRPTDRYANAADLAADLVRFLNHEPVLARRISPVGRLWRFAQRHPGGTAITSAAAAAVIGVTALAYVRAVDDRDRTMRALDFANDQLIEAEEARQQVQDAMTATRAALRNGYWREASLVRLSNRPDRLPEGLGLLRQSAALDPEPPLRAKLRQEAVEFLVSRDVSARQRFATGKARAVAFSQDGGRLTAILDSANGGALGLWDAVTREKLAERPLRGDRPEPARSGGGGGGGSGGGWGGGWRRGPGFGFVSPMAAAGPCMAVVSPDGQGVRLFDALTGARVHDLPMPGHRVLGLYASTDGQRLVTLELGAPRKVESTGPTSPGGETPSPRRGEGGPSGPGGPPDRFEVNLWDTAAPEHPIASLGHWEPDANGMAFPMVAISPDGQFVATARVRGTSVDLWEGGNGEPLAPIDSQVELSALALGAENQLATAGSGEIRLWDLDSRAPLSTITPNQSMVRFLRFSPTGSLLAVVGWLGRDVELWDPAAHVVVAYLPTAEQVDDLAFSPDNRTLVAVGRGTTAQSWSLIEPQARSRLGGFDAPTRSMAFRADGLLAVGTYKGSIRFWQAGHGLQSGAPQEVLGSGPPSSASTPSTPTAAKAQIEPASLAFDDLGRLVTLERDSFRVWNNPPHCSAGELIPLKGPGGLPGISTVLSGSRDGRFMALTLPRSQPLGPPRLGPPPGEGGTPPAPPPPTPGEGRPPEFPRGGGSQVLLWRSNEPGKLSAITPPAPTPGDHDRDRDRGRNGFGSRSNWRSLTVAPDGRRLYLIEFDGSLHVWNLEGEATAVDVRWPDPPRESSALALTPDGTRLAVGGRSGVVTLLDTASGRPVGELSPDSGETLGGVSSLAFSPDGRLLAVGTRQGPVVLWSLNDTTLPRFRLPGHRGNVAALAFDPDGHYLATAGSDRVVDVWDLGALRDEFERLGLGW